MKYTNKKGFTLLEIIIVVIIVGVLASLALPKLFATVEFSRSSEALNSFTTIRSSIERCNLMAGEDFTTCNVFANLDVVQPGDSVGAHFTYTMTTGLATYSIVATRNSLDTTTASGDFIWLENDDTDIEKGGSGAYQGIQ